MIVNSLILQTALNPFLATDAGTQVPGGGGNRTFLAQYQADMAALALAKAKALPSGNTAIKLVLRTPANAYLGVDTGTWSVTNL